jgi:hypothetical protein
MCSVVLRGAVGRIDPQVTRCQVWVVLCMGGEKVEFAVGFANETQLDD